MNRYTRIKNKLSVLKPHYLEIIDQSTSHAEHFEDVNSSETHFKINIAAEIFHDLSLLKQHNMVNELLKEEFNDGLHALSINIINKQ